MKQPSHYVEEVKSILAKLDQPDKDGEAQQPPDPGQPIQEIDVYIEDDRITFIPRTPSQERIIESTPVPPPSQKQHYPHILALSVVYLVLLLSILTVKLWLLVHPPIATITINPQSQQIRLIGTLQLGRVIAPITLTQSQTVPTTGKGHQDARAATGTIVFYNGQAVQQTVAGGTVFTGTDGVRVATDQTITIPPGNPPTYGEATVPAHALLVGSAGNIPAGAIHTTLAIAVFAKNTTPFHDGADERDFRTVTTHDLNEVATALKTTLAQSMQAALQSQVQSAEALITPACTPSVTADHRIGQEATTVRATASESCSAVAYDKDALQTKATDLLSHQARRQFGTGYSLIGDVQVSVKQATATHTIPTLTFSCQGTWVYALSQEAQQHIKTLIAGKPKQEALHILFSFPGIEKASIRWEEQTKLPESLDALHLVIVVPDS